MSTQRTHPEELFDRAIAAVREERVDPQIVDAARDRVARRVAAEVQPVSDDEQGADELRP